jgi:hypothetical protein
MIIQFSSVQSVYTYIISIFKNLLLPFIVIENLVQLIIIFTLISNKNQISQVISLLNISDGIYGKDDISKLILSIDFIISIIVSSIEKIFKVRVKINYKIFILISLAIHILTSTLFIIKENNFGILIVETVLFISMLIGSLIYSFLNLLINKISSLKPKKTFIDTKI